MYIFMMYNKQINKYAAIHATHIFWWFMAAIGIVKLGSYYYFYCFTNSIWHYSTDILYPCSGREVMYVVYMSGDIYTHNTYVYLKKLVMIG